MVRCLGLSSSVSTSRRAARRFHQHLDGGIAEAALGHVDDALEGEIVGRLCDKAQIGQGIADFLALIEARTADDAVIDPQGDEALFEFAHLEGGAHQNGHGIERLALALILLDFLADSAGFFFAIIDLGEGKRLAALGNVGEQRLAQPAFIISNEGRSGLQDIGGGAIVALQLDYLRTGEIALEAQDIVHLGAAPAIYGLIVVAHDADIGFRGRLALGEQAQPEILGGVAVLIFVHQHVFELAVIFGEHFRIFAKQPNAFEQEVAEIGSVERLEARLVIVIELAALAIGIIGAVGRRDVLGQQASVLPGVEHARKLAGRPPLFVDIFRFQQLLDDADLVVGVENGELRLEIDQFGMLAQDAGRDRVEGAHPGQAIERRHQFVNALLHLGGGLVGKGHSENLAAPGYALVENMGDAGGENAGLAGAGAGQNQQRPLGRQHGIALLGIETGEIVRLAPVQLTGNRARGGARQGSGVGHACLISSGPAGGAVARDLDESWFVLVANIGSRAAAV